MRRAAADGEHAGVADHALQRKIARIAGGAEHLQGVIGYPDRRFRGQDLGPRGLRDVGKTGPFFRLGPGGGLHDHQPRRLDAGAHVDQHPLQPLELGDRAAELFALLGVIQGQVIGPLGDAYGHRRCPDPLRVIGVHQPGEAALDARRRNHHHVGGDFQILENQFRFRDTPEPHRRFAGADGQTLRLEPVFRIADADEAGDALFFVAIEDTGEDQVEFRYAAAGDPVLGAVEHVNAAFFVGPGVHFRSSAAGAGLGDADGRLVAGQHQARGQLFLRLGAVFDDRADGSHVALDDDTAGDAADLGHFLDHQHRVQVIQPRAAIGFGNGHAHEALLGQRPDVVPGVFFCSVNIGGARRDLLLRQLARRVAELLAGV